MNVKTSELIGEQLDCAVAQAEGISSAAFQPSTNWAHGGPIIEREGITVYPHYEDVITESGQEMTIKKGWASHITPHRYWQTPRGRGFAPTPLVAAMRCYVASKLGDTVETNN